MTKQIAATAIAAVALVSASAVFAQTAAKPDMHSPMMHKPMHSPMMHKPMHKPMTMSKTVYVCKECKAYYSPTDAKKMGYKDSMGHKMSKMSKAPAGYMDGSKMKM